MREPKILYVITKSNWGGAQAYVHTLATHFHRAGVPVTVALGGTGIPGAAPGRLYDELSAAQVPTAFIQSLGKEVSLRNDWRAFIDLVHLLRRERPTVLHLNSSKIGGLGALAGRLTGVPHIIFTSHGLAYDEDRSPLARLLIFCISWLSFILAHTVIAISSDNAARVRRLPFCRHKVVLIYNGIDASPLLTRDEARARLLPHATPGTHWIGTIAELTENKSLTHLIGAVSILRQQGRPLTVCVLGEGTLRPTLETLIAQEGLSDSVHLLGFVRDAALVIPAFDIFTLTSTKEGLPYVLLEAGLADVPVVATNIPGTTDIVDQDTGMLVPPKNAAALAAALATVLDHPETGRHLAAALKHKVSTTFSTERMFTAMRALYRL